MRGTPPPEYYPGVITSWELWRYVAIYSAACGCAVNEHNCTVATQQSITHIVEECELLKEERYVLQGGDSESKRRGDEIVWYMR